MPERARTLLLLWLLVAILATALLAIGLSGLDFGPGRPLPLLQILLQNLRSMQRSASAGPGGGGDLAFPTLLLRVLFWAGLMAVLIYAVVSPEYRKRLLRTLIVFAAFVLLLSRISPEGEPREEIGLEVAGELAAVGEFHLPEPPPFISEPPDWVLAVTSFLLALLCLAGAWFLWRILHSRSDTRAQLARQAENALAEVRAGREPGNVVIRCYAEMGRILRESRSIERRKAMTPREFENHLAQLGLGDDAIRRLTRLFEEVRYGDRPSDGAIAREATECLAGIVQAFGRPS